MQKSDSSSSMILTVGWRNNHFKIYEVNGRKTSEWFVSCTGYNPTVDVVKEDLSFFCTKDTIRALRFFVCSSVQIFQLETIALKQRMEEYRIRWIEWSNEHVIKRIITTFFWAKVEPLMRTSSKSFFFFFW